MTIEQRLAALAAGPKPFRILTTYEGGQVRHFDAHSAAAAKNFADRERRKIGRELIDRESGAIVRVTAVEIKELAV